MMYVTWIEDGDTRGVLCDGYCGAKFGKCPPIDRAEAPQAPEMSECTA